MGTIAREEVGIAVLLVPDEEDGAVFRACVPGIEGSISTFGSPGAALREAEAALGLLLRSLGAGERDALLRDLPALEPHRVPRGARIERVCVAVEAR